MKKSYWIASALTAATLPLSIAQAFAQEAAPAMTPEEKAIGKKITGTSVIKNALKMVGTPFLYKPSRVLGAMGTKNNQETTWSESLDADKPIAVFNYMTGYEAMPGGATMLGDPAMVQLGAVEQFLDRYVLLVPSQWTWDFLVVTRPEGAGVELDGAAIDDGLFVSAGGGFEVARVPVDDGVHEVDANAPIAVEVVGYDTADSYAYLAGGGTGVINPVPAG
jgi:hypothetical protein